MNRKGFTLVEVIAVIVILGLVMIIVSPYVITAYENSKLKSEEIFVGRLSEVIDDYIKLNSDEITFTSTFQAKKTHESVNNAGESQTVEYYVSIDKGTIKVQDIIDSNLLFANEYRNAGNKEVSCDSTAPIIEIYKDEDFVYCHKVNKALLGCLTDKYKNTISGDYVIDTCVWEVEP